MTEPRVAIADVQPREHARVEGRIVAVRVEPGDGQPQFGVQVDDGSGRIDAIFLGRRSVPGIEPGGYLAVEGTVCASQALPRMFNPTYELLIHA